MNQSNSRGMSLIELLIVIAIIGLLFQLALPAVEMARESARATHCQNNIRQLALASVLHADTHGHYPTGGWNSAWVGDPSRGYSKKQPGSWGYNVLPFIEEQALHDLGSGQAEPECRKAAAQLYGSISPLFTCSSRRAPRPGPFFQTRIIRNADMTELRRLNRAAHSDYAANTGTVLPRRNFAIGPESYEVGDQWENGKDPKTSWVASVNSGVIFQRSEVTRAMITDGLSHTFVLGEKLAPIYPKGIKTHSDDQSVFVGFSYDNNRLGRYNTPPIRDTMVQVVSETPKMLWRFGSAHPTAFHMACCDSSVHRVNYEVDAVVFSAMSTRSLGEKRRLAD